MFRQVFSFILCLAIIIIIISHILFKDRLLFNKSSVNCSVVATDGGFKMC